MDEGEGNALVDRGRQKQASPYTVEHPFVTSPAMIWQAVEPRRVTQLIVLLDSDRVRVVGNRKSFTARSNIQYPEDLPPLPYTRNITTLLARERRK